MRLDMI